MSAARTANVDVARLAEITSARVEGDVVLVAPATTEEVSAVLKVANEAGVVVRVRGGGTKSSWGNAVAADVVIEMHRMNAVLEHAWQDLTVRVQAGCTWGAMQSELAKQNHQNQYGQMVALDPLWPERATVGGIAAVNDSGSLRLRYGGLRDLIIGMTIVLADGTIAKSGGKVVKNVAGYDMHKLMTGAFGTLGVITEVNFRLHPLEQHAETWTIASGDAKALGAVMMKVLDSRMQVSAMQVRRELVKRVGVKQPMWLDVKFAGHPDCLASQQEQLRGLAGGLSMEAGEDAVWLAREKVFDRASGNGRDGLVLKMTMVPGQVPVMMEKLDVLTTEVECVTQATGIMTAAVYGHVSHMPLMIEKLRAAAAGAGGSVTVLRLPEELRGEVDVWGEVGSSLPLMMRVKEELDAKRILNRGCFAGGI